SLHAAIRSTIVVAPSIGNRCLSSRLSTVPPAICGCDSAIILACSKLPALQNRGGCPRLISRLRRKQTPEIIHLAEMPVQMTVKVNQELARRHRPVENDLGIFPLQLVRFETFDYCWNGFS